MATIEDLKIHQQKLESDISFQKAHIQLAISKLPPDVAKHLNGLAYDSQEFQDTLNALILEYGRQATEIAQRAETDSE